MACIALEFELLAPAKQVYLYVSDIENRSEWDTQVLEAKVVRGSDPSGAQDYAFNYLRQQHTILSTGHRFAGIRSVTSAWRVWHVNVPTAMTVTCICLCNAQ